MSVLAIVAAVATIGSSIVDGMKSGADPYQSASFETYESVKLLHDRIGNMEQMLLSIDQKLDRQLQDFRTIIEDENGRQRQIDVWAVIESQRAEFKEMEAELAAGNKFEDVSEIYKASSARNAEAMGPLLVSQIRSGPFRLDTAVLGISAEINMHNIGGTSLPRIRARAESQVNLIRREITDHYEPKLKESEEMLLEATIAVNEHMGQINWRDGGTWMLPEFSGYYAHDKFVYSACLSIQRVESPLPDGLPRYLASRSDAPTYDVTAVTGSIIHPGEANFCGDLSRLQLVGTHDNLSREERIRIGRENVNHLKASGFITPDRFGRREGVGTVGGLGQLSRGFMRSNALYSEMMKRSATTIESRMDSFTRWKQTLQVLLESYNNHADLVEVLRIYGVTVEAGIFAIDEQLAELEAVRLESMEWTGLDKSLVAIAIADVATSQTAIQTSKVQIRDAEEKLFRDKFKAVAQHAESIVRIGMRRHEAVLEAYEQDHRISKIAGALRTMATFAKTMETVEKMLDKLPEASEITRGQSSNIAMEASDKSNFTNGSITSLTGEVTNDANLHSLAPSANYPLAPARTLSPHRMEDIISELKIIRVPLGDPMETNLTRQEILVFEFMELAGAFKMTQGDKAILEYSADQVEAWTDIVLNIGTGQRSAAMLGVLQQMMGPPLGDGTVHSISHKRQLVSEFVPLMNEVIDWRIPQEVQTNSVESLLKAKSKDATPQIRLP